MASPNPVPLSGKTALVIGSAIGIGAAVSRAFAKAGANLIMADFERESGFGLARDIAQETGVGTLFVSIDVRREADFAALMETATARFGRIDIAVNNAGIEGPTGRIHQMDIDDFDNVIATNLRGVWLGMKYQIPHMIEQGGGAIINTSSTASIRAIPSVAVYSASKHGVAGLTKAAALECARDNIRINAVAPGPTRTALLARMSEGRTSLDAIAEKVPLGRVSEPDEIAGAFLWLASEAASFVTGHTMFIDGGLTSI